MTTALGCAAHLAAVGLATFALDRASAGEVAPQLRPWAALIASSLLVLGISNVVQLLRGYGQGDASPRTLLARAATGQPPSDAGPMLAHGTAGTDLAPLRAPLSGTECVAYEYRIFDRSWNHPGGHHIQTVYWWGGACLPFSVRTEGRAVRIGAMPELLMEPDTRRDEATIAQARAFIAATTFDDVAGLDMARAATTLITDLLSAHATGLRRDWRRASLDSPDLSQLRYEERVVPVGATISVAGYWSPERHAIEPQPGGLGSSPVSLTLGAPRTLLRRNTAVPSSGLAVGVAGAVLLLLGGAVVWAMRTGWLAPGAF